MPKPDHVKAMAQFHKADFVHRVIATGLYGTCVKLREGGAVSVPDGVSEDQKAYYDGCMFNFTDDPQIVKADSGECQAAAIKIGDKKEGSHEAVYLKKVYWCLLLSGGTYKGPKPSHAFGSACIFDPGVIDAAKKVLGIGGGTAEQPQGSADAPQKSGGVGGSESTKPNQIPPQEDVSKEVAKKDVQKAKEIFLALLKSDPEFQFYYKELKSESQVEELVKSIIKAVNEGSTENEIRSRAKKRLIEISGLHPMAYSFHAGQEMSFLLEELNQVVAEMDKDPELQPYASKLRSNQHLHKVQEILLYIKQLYEGHILKNVKDPDAIRAATRKKIISKIIELIGD